MTTTERNETPIDGDGPNENGEQKRKEASLRSVEADLKVIVGKGLAGDKQDENIQVYWHFHQALACPSRYVDTLLSTSIGTNNDSNSSTDHKEIVFDYIMPEQWDRMIRFITNPLAFEAMTIEDAIVLAPISDHVINADMIAEFLDGSEEELSFNLIGVINDHFRPNDIVDLNSSFVPRFSSRKNGDLSYFSAVSEATQLYLCYNESYV